MPISEDDEAKDDEFAIDKFDKILAEADDGIQLLCDYADVREAVTYVVSTLVYKVMEWVLLSTNKRRFEMFDYFAKQLADRLWKANKGFPEAGSNKELDQLIQRLIKFKRTPMHQTQRLYFSFAI